MQRDVPPVVRWSWALGRKLGRIHHEPLHPVRRTVDLVASVMVAEVLFDSKVPLAVD